VLWFIARQNHDILLSLVHGNSTMLSNPAEKYPRQEIRAQHEKMQEHINMSLEKCRPVAVLARNLVYIFLEAG
jgi:hypothetical protein